ncbi:translation initiation factor IF-2-like, partial [Amphibalanus amphitrite]|uniref:translation initiation factor IF-2-like n=1 Tax=Amphibalanus amphitrite TaxID=1232801 RepID=UPI001C90669E
PQCEIWQPGCPLHHPGLRSGSPSVGSGSTPRPVPVAGRRVADLVRGWTEAVEPRGSQERPASAGASRQTTTGKPATGGSSGARSPANGGSKSPSGGGSNRAKSPAGGGSNAALTAASAEQPEQRDKVRRRLSSETSAKIPATQSQALGQILTALSRGHSPRAPLRRATTSSTNPATTTTEPGAEVRAEVRRLRELAAQRLRQARLETSDGEVADSLTSATASEDGDASLEERLKLLDDGAGGRHGQPLVLTAGEGLLQRILGGRGGQRLKPRPAGE